MSKATFYSNAPRVELGDKTITFKGGSYSTDDPSEIEQLQRLSDTDGHPVSDHPPTKE